MTNNEYDKIKESGRGRGRKMHINVIPFKANNNGNLIIKVLFYASVICRSSFIYVEKYVNIYFNNNKFASRALKL